MPETFSDISKPAGGGRITPVLNHAMDSDGNWHPVSMGSANGFLSPNGIASISIEVGTGVEQVAGLDAATEYVTIDIKSGSLFVRYDGVDPISGGESPFGHIIEPGTSTTWTKAAAEAARFINATGTKTHVFVSQFV